MINQANISTEKTAIELTKSWLNPLSRIDSFFKQRKIRKEEKFLQLQLAIFSGGIKRMK
jgi:hypothetical protein